MRTGTLTSPKEIAPDQIARGGMASSFPLPHSRKRRGFAGGATSRSRCTQVRRPGCRSLVRVTQSLLSLCFRLWWVPVFAVTVGTAALTLGADTGDLPFFVHAADDLFSRAWADAYANPDLQIGPLQLLLLALADALAGALSLSTQTLLAFAVPVGVTALFLVSIRRLLAERPERGPLVLMAAGVIFAALG